MQSNAIAMQCNAIACDCNAIQSDCNAMRLRCNAIAMQCNAIATQCDCNNRIPFVAEYKLTEGPGGTRAKRNQPGEGPNPPKPRKHFLKKCERFLRRKTKKYAVLAMPPRRIPLPDSSPPRKLSNFKSLKTGILRPSAVSGLPWAISGSSDGMYISIYT